MAQDDTGKSQDDLRAKAATNDGWENVLTGLGNAQRDKRLSAVAKSTALTFAEQMEIYSASATAQRIVDVVAEEATRAWLDVRIEEDEDASEEITADLEDLGAQERFLDALKKMRAFGGCAMLVGVNDGVGDPSLPVNEEAIRSIDFLTNFDTSEATVAEWDGNPSSKTFGEPLIYQINPSVFGLQAARTLERVHASRVLRFTGPIISRKRANMNRGWGDSVLDLVYGSIRDFDTSHDGAAALMQDFAQAVIKIKGLASAVAADRADLIKTRLQLMDMSRSVLRALLIDAEGEDFERKGTPLTGLPDLLDRFAQKLAADARIPVTVLMGQSPAGLNATGASDIRIFYDSISQQQQDKVRPQMLRLARYAMLCKGSATDGSEADNYSIAFRPLWQQPEAEKATVRLSTAQADQIYLQAGVLDAGEIRQNRFGGDAFSLDTVIEVEEPGEIDSEDATANAEGVARIDPATGEPAQVMPGQTAPVASGAAATKVQDTALNGAQISSALEIVKAVAAGELPRDAGVAMLAEFFQLDPTRAEKIMGSVGNGFVAKVQPDPAPAFGGRPPTPRPNNVPDNTKKEG